MQAGYLEVVSIERIRILINGYDFYSYYKLIKAVKVRA